MEITDRKLIIGLIIIQIVITLPFINSFPIDLDEPFSIFYAQQNLGDLFNLFSHENNPPLHFVLLHYWISVFGIEATSVRSLSLLFSVLTIPYVYLISRVRLSKAVSVVVVLLLIFSNYFHYQSLEARVYALFLMLFIATVYYLYQFIFEDKNVIVQLTIFGTLFLYSHYLAILILGILFLITLLYYANLNYKKWISILISGISIILLYSPMLWLMFNRVSNVSENGTWVPSPHWSELYGNIVKFCNGKWSMLLLFSLFLVLILIFKNGLLKRFKHEVLLPKNHFFFVVFGMCYAAMYLISLIYTPIFLDKYLMFLTPILFIIFGIVLKIIIGEKGNKIAFVLILPFVVFINYIPNNNREGAAISEYIELIKDSNTQIVICPPFYEFTFLYHYDKQMFKDYKNYNQNLSSQNISLIYGYSDIIVSESIQDIIFIDCNSKFLFPENNINEKLNQNYRLIESKSFKGDYSVSKFEVK